MSNTSSSSSVNFVLLNQVINRYTPIPLLFLGTIENILNILVFTRKLFRNNVCVNYFLASAISDSFVIIISLLPRLLYGFDVDPTQNSTVLCKLRFFITYSAGYAAAWFISLACIERYLSSSSILRRHHLITMKRAYLSMFLIILLGLMFFGEQLYCIDINQQLLGAPQSCYQLKQDIQCQLVDSLMQFIFEILMPALIMLVFGFLTFRNIRQRRLRISAEQSSRRSMSKVAMRMAHYPVIHEHSTNVTISRRQPSTSRRMNRAIKKRNAQLIPMLFVQVAVFIITTFPISAYKLYSIATIYETKLVLHKSIENTIFNASVISLFVNNSITFYIYTLCGTVFRKELMKLLCCTQPAH